MSSVDATRIEKVEVVTEFPVVHAVLLKNDKAVLTTLREKDARDLMHALGSALGYEFQKRDAESSQ